MFLHAILIKKIMFGSFDHRITVRLPFVTKCVNKTCIFLYFKALCDFYNGIFSKPKSQTCVSNIISCEESLRNSQKNYDKLRMSKKNNNKSNIVDKSFLIWCSSRSTNDSNIDTLKMLVQEKHRICLREYDENVNISFNSVVTLQLIFWAWNSLMYDWFRKNSILLYYSARVYWLKKKKKNDQDF